MSNRIDDLVPEVAELCRQHLALCAREGLLLRVTQTLRTYLEQDALYAQGRTAPGARVTAAPGGYSWHCFGRAYDVCQADRTPYDIGAPGHDAEDEAFWEKVGGLGEGLGLIWGGRWKHPDLPHFEYPDGNTLAQLRQQHNNHEKLA